jgi:hypothetical protein
VETIDFFVNANAGLDFLLTNALKNSNSFELDFNQEWIGKYIGFSENRPDVLVVHSTLLGSGKTKQEHEKIRLSWDIRDLKVD